MRDPYVGWHLTIDGIVGKGEPTERLGNMQFLDGFLRELVNHLDMQILGGPHLYEVQPQAQLVGTDEDEGGITGTVIVTTSHVSIHTWPLRNRFALDVFSCKKFDKQEVVDLVSDRLEILPGRRGAHWIVRHWV